MITCPCGASFKSHASVGGHARRCSACTPDVRFWLKVEKGDGCWNWTGALQRDGYAHVNMDGRTVSSHRYAYEQLVGPIAEGMDLLHSCDNRRCVNPSHLRQGTHQENMDEAKAKMRHTFGIKNRSAILNDELVLKLRAEYKRTGWNQSNVRELAEKYNLPQQTVSNAVNGRTWRHL